MADQSLLRSSLFEQYDFTALFTLRHEGVSPPPFDSFNFGYGLGDAERNIEQNLHILQHAAELPGLPHQLIQVHGTEHYLAEGPGYMHSDEADILISNQPGTALGVRTADCLPVMLADPEAGIIAAVHAGWRGTAAAVVNRALDEMLKQGAIADKIIASLGPCIGPCCFKIGEDTAQQLSASCSGSDSHILRSPEPHADIKAINRLQLLTAGIDASRIEMLGACTACHPEHYFSYRRDGKKSGRHLGVVALPSRP